MYIYPHCRPYCLLVNLSSPQKYFAFLLPSNSMPTKPCVQKLKGPKLLDDVMIPCIYIYAYIYFYLRASKILYKEIQVSHVFVCHICKQNNDWMIEHFALRFRSCISFEPFVLHGLLFSSTVAYKEATNYIP